MASDGAQKHIGRNNAPRVQIEYEVELYGSEKKVQLPFVMGVLADLGGKSKVEAPSIEERKFLEVDRENFDNRMEAIKPRVVLQVDNTLTGEGQINVEIEFDKMDDFSPAAVARKVGPLKELLTARTQLSNLITYLDGKSGAESLIEKAMANPALLQALASTSPSPSTPTPSASDDAAEQG